jgi:GalNAc-alpha-(1->4)-GalNAc-alpha-(1->3)-diNAcBac-PP-undecaprenol alpha-1,4-N-acetyl-D-galactosaminyltransferase
VKILFLTSSMGGGGAERVAALLANAWTAHGHDITLMPTFSARGECVYRLAERVELEFLSDHCKAGANRLARLKILRRFIGALRPHVIVSFLPHVNIGALIAARGTGIPVVACERTYPPRLMPPLPLSYRILRRLTYPWAAALVAQTEATAKWLRRRARRAKTVVISNPIALPMVDADPVIPPAALLKSGDRVILWVGRMDAAKRPDIMVDAFARLAGAAKRMEARHAG